MPRRRKKKRWGMPKDRKEPLMARMSLILLLACVFVFVGLRHTDVLVMTLSATVVSFLGWILALVAKKRIRRHGGRIGGEGLVKISYYGNLVVFLLSSLMFVYALAMGILRGELL